MTVKHKHHIIPRHASGTDDISNIIELTIEEHAEAHRLLYEQHNRPEDRLAWQALSGMLSRQEIIQELCRIAGTKGGKIAGAMGKGKPKSPQHRAKISNAVRGENNGMYGKQLTPDQKLKQGQSVRAHIDSIDGEWQGSTNLKESVQKRLTNGTHPTQLKWECVCGKSGIGKSNFTRWHSKCQITV